MHECKDSVHLLFGHFCNSITIILHNHFSFFGIITDFYIFCFSGVAIESVIRDSVYTLPYEVIILSEVSF